MSRTTGILISHEADLSLERHLPKASRPAGRGRTSRTGRRSIVGSGCTIHCSNVFGDEEGILVISPLEYETIGLMSANLGIDDLGTVARLNWQVNDLGLDSIETGAVLGVG